MNIALTPGVERIATPASPCRCIAMEDRVVDRIFGAGFEF